MDKVDQASYDSFPASDPPAYVAGKDAYVRTVIPIKERRERQAIENKAAMADYNKAQQHRMDNLSKLRAERVERETAVNEPIDDNARMAISSTQS